MKQLRSAVSLIAISFAITLGAYAQAARTWISGVGDDANPCSRTAPCKTLAGAISKTVAGGEIDVLDPEAMSAINITKAITIDGGGGMVAGIQVTSGNGITVSAGINDSVTLRNISILGLGTGTDGIRMNSGKALHIEHCRISRFAQNGINILSSTGALVLIDDTISQDNGGNGLNVVASSSNVRVDVVQSRFLNNSNGIYSGDFSRTSVRSSEASGNAQAGFIALANSGSATLSVTDSTAASNLGVGVQAGGGSATSSVRVAQLSLYSNVSGFVTQTNGTISSFGTNYNSGSGTPNGMIPLQ